MALKRYCNKLNRLQMNIRKYIFSLSLPFCCWICACHLHIMNSLKRRTFIILYLYVLTHVHFCTCKYYNVQKWRVFYPEIAQSIPVISHFILYKEAHWDLCPQQPYHRVWVLLLITVLTFDDDHEWEAAALPMIVNRYILWFMNYWHRVS